MYNVLLHTLGLLVGLPDANCHSIRVSSQKQNNRLLSNLFLILYRVRFYPGCAMWNIWPIIYYASAARLMLQSTGLPASSSVNQSSARVVYAGKTHQRIKCKDSVLIGDQFKLFYNFRAKYGILDDIVYNFDETGFTLDFIFPWW